MKNDIIYVNQYVLPKTRP